MNGLILLINFVIINIGFNRPNFIINIESN